MLGATVQNVFATVTWRSEFEHPIAKVLHVELHFSDPLHLRDLLYKDRNNWPCIQHCPLSTPCFSSCLPYVYLNTRTASRGNLRIFDCDPRTMLWASVQIKRVSEMQRSEMVRNFIPLVLLFRMAFCSGISILELGRTTYHQFTFLNAIIGAYLGLMLCVCASRTENDTFRPSALFIPFYCRWTFRYLAHFTEMGTLVHIAI